MSEKTEQKFRRFPMAIGTEAYTLIHEIGGGIRPIKTAIWQVYRLLSAHVPTSVSRVKDLWYGDQRVVVRADEMDALRRVAADIRHQKSEAKNVLGQLADTYRAAAERLRALDPDYHQFEIARLERLAGEICPADSPGTAGASPVAHPNDGEPRG